MRCSKLHTNFDTGATVIALDVHCAMLIEQPCKASVENRWILGGGIYLCDSYREELLVWVQVNLISSLFESQASKQLIYVKYFMQL